MTDRLIGLMASRGLDSSEFWGLLRLPSSLEVHAMPVLKALLMIPVLDCSRVFGVWRARRRACGSLRTLLGLAPSGEREFEHALRTLRSRALLAQKMLFLAKTQRVFYLWHLIHRPFSVSFALLVLIHVAVVVSLGYF